MAVLPIRSLLVGVYNSMLGPLLCGNFRTFGASAKRAPRGDLKLRLGMANRTNPLPCICGFPRIKSPSLEVPVKPCNNK